MRFFYAAAGVAEAVDLMVFQLGWDAMMVQDMTADEIAHWCNRAVIFAEQKRSRS